MPSLKPTTPSEEPQATSSSTSGGAALAFRNINKRFGDKQALADVSFAVEPARILGLLGKNGAGKTTLIRLALDILRPDSGELFLFGEPPSRRALDRVAYLPEERGLYRKTTVETMLTYLGRLRGFSSKHTLAMATPLLEELGVAGALPQPTESLSKGMTQKIQLVATLFFEPELCILDEPFSGLDPASALVIREIIRKRRKPNLTTVLSTHMMNQVEELCDDVVILHDGRVVASSTRAALREAHSPNQLRLRGRDLPEVPGVDLRRAGETFIATLPEDLAPANYLASLVNAGASIDAMEPLYISMETIFLSLTEDTK